MNLRYAYLSLIFSQLNLDSFYGYIGTNKYWERFLFFNERDGLSLRHIIKRSDAESREVRDP